MEVKYHAPSEIEKASMNIIENELAELGIELPMQNSAVVRRVIHATADFDYAKNLKFIDDAVENGVEALRNGTTIVTDTNMARAGISKPSAAKLGCELKCFIADEDVTQRASELGCTRATISMDKTAELYPNAVIAVGNAPTALLRLCELMDSGLRPSLIIGVPVGFVNVVDSKLMLEEACNKYGVPAIIAMGQKGGSNVAAAICNALLYTATDTIDPVNRGWK